MSNKSKDLYVCANCDAQFNKWNGRCLECGKWGTLKLQTISEKSIEAKKIIPAEFVDLKNIKDSDSKRFVTGIDEVDRVLGGGIVPGSMVLLSGEPGIGKSTIVAQIANALLQNNKVIYASGEESASQVKNRLERLDCNFANLLFLNETNVEKIVSSAEKAMPALLIIDSIQTVYSQEIESEAGNLSQIRASAVHLLELAKKNNIAVFLIGHITKDGSIAGPKSLEHIVDCVLYLEIETKNDYRILRAAKNRFGSVNEIGIFEMTGSGFKEVKNSAGIFLDDTEEKISGSVISAVMEGTRPFLVEIQALVTKTVFGYPQRKASGYDLNRLQVLSAVLTKRANINLTNQDIILNVVGGLKINDPALDLAICLSIVSSLLNQTISRDTIVLGEVGLGGEVRKVSKLEERLKEAHKLGFKNAIIPNVNLKNKNLNISQVKNLSELIKLI